MQALRLLVVDDSPTIRKVVELSFRNTPVAVDFATSGHEGLSKVGGPPSPQVILLDCVLPDMKAMEACQRLHELLREAGPREAGAPDPRPRIVLMSAKERASLREVFERFPLVVDFLAKPFTAEDLRARVQAAAARAEAAVPVKPGRVVTPVGPAPQVASKASARPAAVATKSDASEQGDAPLQGSTRGFGFLPLLRAVAAEGRTGELVLALGEQRLLSYWDCGELVLCTSHDPREYAGESPEDLGGVALEARQAAEAEQRTTGTPLYVTLTDGGAWLASASATAAREASPAERLVSLLAERSARLVRAVLRAPHVRFAWHDRALPPYVQTLGRPLALEGSGALVAGAAPAGDVTADAEAHAGLGQLELERLRKPSAWPLAGLPLPSPDDCYDRAAGFGGKLKALRLTAAEQRVLSLVARQTTLRTMAVQTGLALREVTRILARLEVIDLVQRVPLALLSSPATSVPATASTAAAVMVLDTDVEGFCRPLRDRLARLPRPVQLFDLSDEDDIPMAIARERPGLVVLNEAAAPGRLVTIARAVRAMPHLANTALLALVAEDAGTADFLSAAGFDAVWSKPVHVPDLCALLPLMPA